MIDFKLLFAVVAALSSSAALALDSDSISSDALAEPIAAAATLTAPLASGEEEPHEAVHRRQFHRAPDGLFYIHAAANGTPVRFVVDTGATVVVLSRHDAARLGLSYESLERGARMNTVGGPSAMKWTEIEKLEMAGKKLEGIAAAVVDQGLPVSLLGQNALSLLGTVTLKGNVLTIE